MEKKLFIASAVLCIFAIVFAILFFTNNKPETDGPIDLTDSTILDADHDGLTTQEEQAAKTDPNKSDTDGDGLSDLIELRQYGTNPLSQDTDRDGYGDRTEINSGHDPLTM